MCFCCWRGMQPFTPSKGGPSWTGPVIGLCLLVGSSTVWFCDWVTASGKENQRQAVEGLDDHPWHGKCYTCPLTCLSHCHGADGELTWMWSSEDPPLTFVGSDSSWTRKLAEFEMMNNRGEIMHLCGQNVEGNTSICLEMDTFTVVIWCYFYTAVFCIFVYRNVFS